MSEAPAPEPTWMIPGPLLMVALFTTHLPGRTETLGHTVGGNGTPNITILASNGRSDTKRNGEGGSHLFDKLADRSEDRRMRVLRRGSSMCADAKSPSGTGPAPGLTKRSNRSFAPLNHAESHG